MLRNFLTTGLVWCGNNRVLLFTAGVLWSASILLALVWPLPGPDGSQNTLDSGLSRTRDLVAPVTEDLNAFLRNKRWGVSLEEIIEQTAMVDRRSVNPVLRQMGYVGLISSVNSNEVILLMPEGGTQRLTIGDSLPDGRELMAIDENSLTLRDAQQNTQVLVLFPELLPEMREYPAKIDDVADTQPQDRR